MTKLRPVEIEIRDQSYLDMEAVMQVGDHPSPFGGDGSDLLGLKMFRPGGTTGPNRGGS